MTGADDQRRLDGWRLSRAVVGALLAALSAVAFAPAFGTGATAALADVRYAGVLAGVVVAVTGVGVLLRIGTGIVPLYRVVAGFAALAGYVWLVISPGRAAAAGARRLLSTALPIEPTGPELAVVTTVVGLAAIAAVEPALRQRGALPQLVGPLLATGTGCAVSASAGRPVWWLAPAFAVSTAVLLALARYSPDPASGPDPAGTAETAAPRAVRLVASALTVGLLAAVALAGWYGPAMTAPASRPSPADARALVDQTVTPRLGTSPLAMFAALRSGRRTLSLNVTTDDPTELLRYASLDRFDGTSWTTQARYRRAGRWLPPGPPAPVEQREETVVVLDGDILGWLVASGRPVEVSVPGLGVDEVNGDVAVPVDRAVPQRYTVRSTVPAAPQATLDGAVPAARTGTSDPAVPPQLVEWAGQVTGGERGHRALQRLARSFVTDYRLDTSATAPGGHGIYQLNLLRETRTGTAEQYASAFAVLARGLGYDVRVVVGFRARRVSDNEYSVSGRDVHAWAEVRYDRIGWIAYQPTPTQPATSGSDQPDATEEAIPPSAPPSRGPVVSGTAEAAPARRAGDRDGGSNVALLVVYATIGVIALYVSAVPATKAARRARRRRLADPNGRAIGAWRETLDRLGDAGVPMLASDTSRQVVAATRTRYGADVAAPVHGLGLLHDRAMFAPGALEPRDANDAWQHSDAVRRALRAAMRPAHRLLAMLRRPLP